MQSEGGNTRDCIGNNQIKPKSKLNYLIVIIGFSVLFLVFIANGMKVIPNRDLKGLGSIYVQSVTIAEYYDLFNHVMLKEKLRLSVEQSKAISSIVEMHSENSSYEKQDWPEILRIIVDSDLGQYLVTFSIGTKDSRADIEYSGKKRVFILSQEANSEIRRFINKYIEYTIEQTELREGNR